MTVPPKLTEPDRSLLVKCIGPTDIGTKALTQIQIERLWTTDRKRLLNCARLHGYLIDFTTEQLRLLRGTK